MLCRLDAQSVPPRAGPRLQSEVVALEEFNQLGPGESRGAMDARRHPRFKIDVDIRVYPRDCPVVRVNTVDINKSGISAMLRVEVPAGEVVRLEFTLPLGDVEVLAMVRQRIAFRYGFQFIDAVSAGDVIAGTCRELSVEQFAGRVENRVENDVKH